MRRPSSSATVVAKEDKESWRDFLLSLRQRGLKGVRLVVGN
nr:transposase [Mitsuokella multacida]